MAMIKQQTRNQSMELAKLIAACFVVFIHVPFAGRLGRAVGTVARFAVPFFFMVSGYFSLGIGVPKVKKRIVHILKLHLTAIVLSLLFQAVLILLYRGTMSDAFQFLRDSVWVGYQNIYLWIMLQVNPYGGHFWYLSALLLCYLVLLGYATFWGGVKQNNGPLYFAGFVLFAIYFTITCLLPAERMDFPFKAYRNGWLTGIPMFTMGMFLNEYRQQLIERFSLTTVKMWMLIALGILLSIFQSFVGYSAEIPFGMYFMVPALVLFLAENPRIPVSSVWLQNGISRMGAVSTAVYMLHLSFLGIYNVLLKDRISALVNTREENLRPLVVLAMTLLVSFAWDAVQQQITRKNKKSPQQ